jgi:EARP and GARP complex-interacting protein 1
MLAASLAGCVHRLLKFWDLRAPGKPLKSVLAHRNHWATCARYNSFHDQLLATAGSDGAVSMWRVSSLSSSPSLLDVPATAAESDSPSDQAEASDVRVRTFDDHEDSSIVSLAWSAHDAWVLASLSYNGRVVVHHVPSHEKYNILL